MGEGEKTPQDRGERTGMHSGPTSRRGFLVAMGAGLTALGAALLSVPVVGYVIATVFHPGPSLKWVKLGPVASFTEGQTLLVSYRNPFRVPWDGKTADIPCWVRRIRGERFQIFAINCTHLGCPVRWFPESALFMCPCHGGVFYEDGRRAAGPPPRGLYQYRHRVEQGQLWVLGGRIPTLTESV